MTVDPKTRAIARCLITTRKLRTLFAHAEQVDLAQAAVLLTSALPGDIDRGWLKVQVNEALNAVIWIEGVPPSSGIRRGDQPRKIKEVEDWEEPRLHPRLAPETIEALGLLRERWSR